MTLSVLRAFDIEAMKLGLQGVTIIASSGGRSRIGARGEATSSEFQLIAYPCYVSISKHFPPTIYHGQGLA